MGLSLVSECLHVHSMDLDLRQNVQVGQLTYASLFRVKLILSELPGSWTRRSCRDVTPVGRALFPR